MLKSLLASLLVLTVLFLLCAFVCSMLFDRVERIRYQAVTLDDSLVDNKERLERLEKDWKRLRRVLYPFVKKDQLLNVDLALHSLQCAAKHGTTYDLLASKYALCSALDALNGSLGISPSYFF